MPFKNRTFTGIKVTIDDRNRNSKTKGLSQSYLAEKINISRTHMRRIETADCAVSLDVVFDICRVPEISEKELFDFRM